MSQDVRFVRIRGRVVPIRRSKSSEPNPAQAQKQPTVSDGAKAGAVFGAGYGGVFGGLISYRGVKFDGVLAKYFDGVRAQKPKGLTGAIVKTLREYRPKTPVKNGNVVDLGTVRMQRNIVKGNQKLAGKLSKLAANRKFIVGAGATKGALLGAAVFGAIGAAGAAAARVNKQKG